MAYIKEVLTQLKARQPWEKVSASSGKSSISKRLPCFSNLRDQEYATAGVYDGK
jgi:hypothetical protein